MSQLGLSDAARWARHMSQAQHRPECAGQLEQQHDRNLGAWIEDPDDHNTTPPPHPTCPGCVTDRDRQIWKQEADQLEQHILANR